MAKKKHMPPAKIKYDKAHPIVSFRANAELKQKLEEIKIKSGKSLADVLKEAVKLQATTVNDAWTRGYLSAQIHHGVAYKCYKCGKVMEISTPGEQEAAAQYMQDHKWGHGEYPKE
jgi:predicted DNA-binding protein